MTQNHYSESLFEASKFKAPKGSHSFPANEHEAFREFIHVIQLFGISILNNFSSNINKFILFK